MKTGSLWSSLLATNAHTYTRIATLLTASRTTRQLHIHRRQVVTVMMFAGACGEPPPKLVVVDVRGVPESVTPYLQLKRVHPDTLRHRLSTLCSEQADTAIAAQNRAELARTRALLDGGNDVMVYCFSSLARGEACDAVAAGGRDAVARLIKNTPTYKRVAAKAVQDSARFVSRFRDSTTVSLLVRLDTATRTLTREGTVAVSRADSLDTFLVDTRPQKWAIAQLPESTSDSIVIAFDTATFSYTQAACSRIPTAPTGDPASFVPSTPLSRTTTR